MFDYAVVILRAQPFHNHHKALVDRALTVAKEVVIVLGSASPERTARNPFLVSERRKMIKDCYPGQKFHFVAARDVPDDDALWAEIIWRNLTPTVATRGKQGALVGNCKPGEPNLSRLFPDLVPLMTEERRPGSGTDIRDSYFGFGERDIVCIANRVPEAVKKYLDLFERTEDYWQVVDHFTVTGITA